MKLKKIGIFIIIFAVIKLTANYLDKVLTRDSAIVTIEAMYNIPRECTYTVFHSQRSNAPDRSFPVGFCGGINTDKGSFLVVENGEFFPFADARRDIVNELVEGCTYQVEFYGPGPTPQIGDGARNRPRKTIFSAERIEPCPAQ